MNVNDLSIVKYIYKELHRLKGVLTYNKIYNKSSINIKDLVVNEDDITVSVEITDNDDNNKFKLKNLTQIDIPLSYFKAIDRNCSIDSIFGYDIEYITEKLNEYCGFDINDLFKLNDLIDIFGGSLRDIINGDNINDIDILTTTYGSYKIEKFLLKNGYVKMDDYIKRSIQNLYDEIKFIHEPVTYRKNDSYIQIIRPSGIFGHNMEEVECYEIHKKLLSNVDISCCGISFDGLSLKENVKNAILHAKYKRFKVYHDNLMSIPDRLSSRIWKFEQRGYRQILNESDERDMVIKNIIDVM